MGGLGTGKSWRIGKWNSPMSITRFPSELTIWEFRIYCKYWELYLGHTKIRLWKPKWMRCFHS